jgi:hypothetical protein
VIKRLIAIGFIFACTSVAWGILAGVTAGRTHLADSGLRSRVQHLWGMPQMQQPPVATAILRAQRRTERLEDGKKIVEMVEHVVKERVGMEASDIRAAIALEHRQKGLLWYSTYKVDFNATYVIVNHGSAAREFEIALPFPAKRAVFDDLRFELEGKPWVAAPAPGDDRITGRVELAPGEQVVLKAGYRSQGLDRWSYSFGEGISEVRNFRLSLRTNFDDIDFPEDSISPARKERSGSGWHLTWEFRRLVSGITIAVVMPEKLQPGPLASQISAFAPVSLFFFIVVLLTVGIVKRVELHPMHFFFLSAAFFAFHLLFAYLADQVSIHAAFLIAAAVSLALVTSYLRLVIGPRFAFFAAGSAQLVYLVLFSYAFFFKGLTGLAVTIGAIVTLFVLMQVTARVRWETVFAPPAAAASGR